MQTGGGYQTVDVRRGLAQIARLPQITGFVLGGVLVGPFGLNLLRAEGLPSLAVVRPPARPSLPFNLSSLSRRAPPAPCGRVRQPEREAGLKVLSLEVVRARLRPCAPLPTRQTLEVGCQGLSRLRASAKFLSSIHLPKIWQALGLCFSSSCEQGLTAAWRPSSFLHCDFYGIAHSPQLLCNRSFACTLPHERPQGSRAPHTVCVLRGMVRPGCGRLTILPMSLKMLAGRPCLPGDHRVCGGRGAAVGRAAAHSWTGAPAGGLCTFNANDACAAVQSGMHRSTLCDAFPHLLHRAARAPYSLALAGECLFLPDIHDRSCVKAKAKYGGPALMATG